MTGRFFRENTERDDGRERPRDHPKNPGPVRAADAAVLERVADGHVAIQGHGRDGEEDVRRARCQHSDEGCACRHRQLRVHVHLQVEDEAHGEVRGGREQQVEDEHEAGMAAQPLLSQYSPVNDEIKEEQNHKVHRRRTDANVDVHVLLRGFVGRRVFHLNYPVKVT